VAGCCGVKDAPYFTISKESARNSGHFLKVYQSPIDIGELNPIWKDIRIKVSKLCDGDFKRNLRFEFFTRKGRKTLEKIKYGEVDGCLDSL